TGSVRVVVDRQQCGVLSHGDTLWHHPRQQLGARSLAHEIDTSRLRRQRQRHHRNSHVRRGLFGSVFAHALLSALALIFIEGRVISSLKARDSASTWSSNVP